MAAPTFKSLDELNGWLGERNLGGMWDRKMARPEAVQPCLWKWSDIHTGLTASADLVPMDQVAMRTVQLRNPSLNNQMTRTIHFSVQILAPGERTIAHRALTAEARFVVAASPGAEFVVEGESFPMEPGDFITTPSWCYHDHHNGSSDPAIWIDSMELSLGALNGPGIGNQLPEKYQRVTKTADFSTHVLTNVKPVGVDWELQPPLRYRWDEAFGALTALKENEIEADPYDGYRVSYANPLTGGPTFPTRSGALQLLRAGEALRTHRHNSTMLYYVARGSGVTIIGDERFEWDKGDIFLVPPWSWHSHANANSEDAVLFTMDDAPTMQALGYYREEGG